MTGRLSPLAYVPRRRPLQMASLGPVTLFLGAYLVASFLSSDPAVLVAATVGAALVGWLSGVGRAVRFSLWLGLLLLVTLVVVNAIVTGRGETVLARFGTWPLLGQVNVTAEAIAAGLVIGLRALGTMVVIGVWSAAVDPDRILRAVHGFARRSALTATLISRLVPLAASDQVRLSEAAGLRGPAATPVGRGAMAQRLLAGSLDRAVDVAATLELRGYGLGVTPGAESRRRSRFDRRFLVAGGLLAVLTVALLVSGQGGLTAYPRIAWSPGPLTALAAVAFPAGALATWRRGRRFS